jgi:iron complex outermembrane recepter protein
MGKRSRDSTRRVPAELATVASGILRALCLCAPIAAMGMPSALAQQLAPTALMADIPAQPLGEALAVFANQTGLQLVYVSGVVDGQRSRAVRAGLKPEAALSRLLRGTGLRFEYLTPRSIRILNTGALAKAPPSTVDDEIPHEIIVTANRRSEALQTVPITIQVLEGATLSNLNATTFDDFVSYLPGVTSHGVGPAQNNIYVRGLGTSEFPNQAAGTNGVFPNVAVYLDEQSAQLPGRNLDIYAVDLDRIEVLEGPQGTLFGAGAEAGVIRYITNKPKLNITEAAVNARYATTAHGDPSSGVDAVINIPLIEDTLAVRGVIYDEKRGGYIDNTPATFARAASDPSISYAHYTPGEVPSNSVVINNSSLVARNINPVTYQGIRLQTFYQFNESWNALLSQSYQSLEADGVFTETAIDPLGVPQSPLTVQLFNPSYDKDQFENTALTVYGRVGQLDVVYAGAYSVRKVEQVQDYTNYARGGGSIDYYQCVNPGSTPATAQCFSPSATWRDQERNTHQSHELRVSTPADGRIRGVGGLFYEKYKIQDQGDWFYLTALPYFYPIGPPTGTYVRNGQIVCICESKDGAVFVPGPVTSNNPNVRPPSDAFFNDTTRAYQQQAAFMSVDFDLVPHVLTLTAGTRYFQSRSSEVGSLVSSFGCSRLDPTAPNPCLNRESTDLDAAHLRRTYTGFRSRASLSWKVNDDAMLYYTWSQGFRAGGFNRRFSAPQNSPLTPGDGDWQVQAKTHKGWRLPFAFEPDTLINSEVGWKSRWRDGLLQWNGALYQEDWEHAQVGAESPGLLGGGAIVNGGHYRVRGVETSAELLIADGLTVDIGAAWNHSRLVKEAPFYWADGTPIDFGTLHLANDEKDKVANPAGTLGSPLAGAPPFQGNIRARYEFEFDGYRVFMQAGAVHQAHSLSATDPLALDLQDKSTLYDLPSFTTYEGALGAGRDAWAVQVYGENLTDTRAQLYANYAEYVKAVTVNRPRTIGVRMSYKFSGG